MIDLLIGEVVKTEEIRLHGQLVRVDLYYKDGRVMMIECDQSGRNILNILSSS